MKIHAFQEILNFDKVLKEVIVIILLLALLYTYLVDTNKKKCKIKPENWFLVDISLEIH